MKTLEYKGFYGSVEYSKEDACFFGQVLWLPKETMISYEGNTPDELYADFKEALDVYLEHHNQSQFQSQKLITKELEYA